MFIIAWKEKERTTQMENEFYLEWFKDFAQTKVRYKELNCSSNIVHVFVPLNAVIQWEHLVD